MMIKTKKHRLLALLVDLFFVSVISGFLKNVKLFDFVWFGLSISAYLNASFFVFLFYFLLFSVVNNGISFGKMLLKIKVVRKNTKIIPDLKNRIIRAVLKSFAIFIFVITFIDYLIFNELFYDRLLKLKTICSK